MRRPRCRCPGFATRPTCSRSSTRAISGVPWLMLGLALPAFTHCLSGRKNGQCAGALLEVQIFEHNNMLRWRGCLERPHAPELSLPRGLGPRLEAGVRPAHTHTRSVTGAPSPPVAPVLSSQHRKKAVGAADGQRHATGAAERRAVGRTEARTARVSTLAVDCSCAWRTRRKQPSAASFGRQG